MKKNNKKGFTLAELLIVVAIIGVLVAVSIPIFTAQLKKARLATNQANARSAKAAAVAEYLTASDGTTGLKGSYDVKTGKFSTGGAVTGTISDNITEWNTDSFGGSVFSTWYVDVNSDGSVAYSHN